MFSPPPYPFAYFGTAICGWLGSSKNRWTWRNWQVCHTVGIFYSSTNT